MAPDSFPSGTVTFLFTDLEGSTRLWQEHPDEMRTALVRHDELLRAAVAANHGHTVKTTGDGIHAAFGAAHDAIEAAVRAQHAIADEDWGALGPLRVRIGVHTGPAEARDGDYFGTAVNRAARLMSTAHGGQVVCSQATAELLQDDLPTAALIDLGEHRLRDLARPVRVYQISDAGLPQDFPTLRSLDNAPTNLPVQPTSLVGRGKLIADLASLLDRDPVVTLTGVGGVGKTRLALEVGAETLPMFADGVWVVDLAPIAHDEMVLATIAEVLGIAAQTGEPLATTIISRLRSKRLLLILDNCEHVLTPVARFVDRLVSRSPGVRVLATSREPLGIAAERVRAVPPLAEDTEAVDLFVERAAHVDATFDSAEQRRAIREICSRLDGIPLAIELAAARTRMMAPTQIAERLNQRFRLLTGGGRTAVERHRTLQATVAWSYELLDELERSVFQRLSTLAGSFDLPAAEAIAAGDPVEDFEVLDALGHLVDKSMVGTVGASDGVRYRMLETLRQFAAERLAERPNPIEVHDRHARYWRDRAVTLGRASGGTDYAAVLDAIDIDLDNYRTAFAHLLATGRINDAVNGILALYGYWQIRRPREGLQWNQRSLNYSELDARNRQRAMAFVAQLTAHIGDMRTAERVASDAIALAEAEGTEPQWGTLMALLMVGSQSNKDPVAYRRWYEHGLRAAGNDRYRRIITEGMRGGVFADDEVEEMLGHYERLHAEIERHGDPVLRVATGVGFANVLRRLGQIDKARTVVRAACDPRAGPTAYDGALCQAAAFEVLINGDIDHARSLLGEAVEIARDEGLTFYVISGAYIAAAIAALQHHFEAAATLLAGADSHAERLGLGEVSSVECRHLALQLLETIGDVDHGNAPGQAMTVDDLIDYMLGVLS